MHPNIAVFYTGETRTIEKTIELFKKNVLLNDNYHVFSVIQNNDNDHVETIVKNTIKDNLKKYIHFNKNDATWLHIRETLLTEMDIPKNWKDYLRNSGSMIEYYQMHLAYCSMEDYEKEHNIKYDFVLRFRTDTALKDQLTFDWLEYNNQQIKEILHLIKDTFNFNTIVSVEMFTIFMNTFYNKKRITYPNQFEYDITQQTNDLLLDIQTEEEFITMLNNYIKNGNFMIGFRVNVIYFIKRQLMDKIHLLGIHYGKYRYEKDSYWFNAECQLRQICLENSVDFFCSCTNIEGKSLYEYNKTNYFDEENQLLENEYSFFIMRD